MCNEWCSSFLNLNIKAFQTFWNSFYWIITCIQKHPQIRGMQFHKLQKNEHIHITSYKFINRIVLTLTRPDTRSCLVSIINFILFPKCNYYSHFSSHRLLLPIFEICVNKIVQYEIYLAWHLWLKNMFMIDPYCCFYL